MKKLLYLFSVVGFLYYSCTPPPPTTEKIVPPPPRPEFFFRIASLTLKNTSKKIEHHDIQSLAQQFKNDSVEIIAVHNIVRYPDLPHRVDFVKVFSQALDARALFGEMVNSGGKQIGNAIFTLYPVLSHNTISFERVDRTSFETALQAQIDVGVTELTFVSAQFPENLKNQQLIECMHLVIDTLRTSHPFIVTGNLSAQIPLGHPFASITHQNQKKNTVIWYNTLTLSVVKTPRTIQTPFGPATIVDLKYTSPQSR